VRCTKCGIDHSQAIGCKQALTLAGNLSGGSRLPSARAPTVALTRCQTCRKLHAPHCGAAEVMREPAAAAAQPARDGMGYDWADAQLAPPVLAAQPPPAPPKARRARRAPHAGETAASLGEYMRRQQEAAETAPVAAIDAIETAAPAAPADSVASVTETAQNGSNPEKSETNGAEVTPKPRPMTNAERQAAHRERHREAIRIIDRERKRAQKGRTN
jgi:hypothetical protein